ncbi:unnamed protein product [Dibothriocephalus latus]|uniref:Uncharacterized protein n=1 Tax=Dibothriocephalus latus TaxID=60516 RepID=A0A3P7P187_DIBLA|nr:unnamed protein product [Dibothriocephalus latus]
MKKPLPRQSSDYCYYYYEDGALVPIHIQSKQQQVDDSRMMPLEPKAFLPPALANWDFCQNAHNTTAAGDAIGSSVSTGINPQQKPSVRKGNFTWLHSECDVSLAI